MRRYAAYVEGNKVGIAMSDEHEDANAQDVGFTEHYFDGFDEIDKFGKDHSDMPREVLSEARELQRGIAQSNLAASATVSGPTEAKYSMLARHGELDSLLAAGKMPGADYFKDLAERDKTDFAKLDQSGRLAVSEDMKRAADTSPDYADGVRDTGVLADREQTLSGEELDSVKRRLAMNRGGSVEIEADTKNANKLQVKRTGKELEEDKFIKPTTISRDYEQVGLEYRMKTKDNLIFRESENGNSLHTASTDKKIVGDMVAMAKAKGWSNIKLTGTQEFRREAWLQSESQGIKTTGFTPKAEDLEILDALKKQRKENGISNLDTKDRTAPRTAANASEATLQTSAKLNTTQHLVALSERPEFKGYDAGQLSKVAELRSLYTEDLKQAGKSGTEVDDALKRFDSHIAKPDNLAQFYKEAETLQERKQPERKAQEAEQTR